MKLIAFSLCGLTAVLHCYFAYLEMFLWNTAKGRRIFGTSKEQAAASAVLAANQGLYNACLAGGLLTALCLPDPAGQALRLYICATIIIVGLYGAYTVNKRILWVQAAPAAAALASLLAV
jgi:putative membrane protein